MLEPPESVTEHRKRVYEKPEVASEQMFDTTALACGMCVAGPFPQFSCGSYPRYD